MTRMLLLAALALACVASPAFAVTIDGDLHVMPVLSAWAVWGVGALAFAGGILARDPVGHLLRGGGRLRLAAASLVSMLICAFVAAPAFSAEVATIGDKAVILPWGDWLVALAVSLREPILTILLPIIAAYIIQAIRKVYPWAALFLSQRRVEMMLEAAVGFGLNAVNGAAKGKTLSVNVAVPVIAKGTQYVIDTAPPAVIKAAGGADGIAARIFRKLDLDDHASEAAVLVPAQEQVAAGTVDAAELRRMEEMTRR
jgi:hypothetical protein